MGGCLPFSRDGVDGPRCGGELTAVVVVFVVGGEVTGALAMGGRSWGARK